MSVYIYALSLQNYRGIGSKTQKIIGITDFNFFIGANNSGKSTVLNFISRYLPPKFSSGSFYQQSETYEVGPLERHRSESGDAIRMGIGVEAERAEEILMSKIVSRQDQQMTRANLRKLLDYLADEDGLLWIGSEVPYTDGLHLTARQISNPQDVMNYHAWRDLCLSLARMQGGDLSGWVEAVLRHVDQNLKTYLPRTRLIPAIRQVGPKGAPFIDFTGAGVIDQLAALQNPEHDQLEDRKKFQKINRFLQTVTGKGDAEIEIPYSRDHVLVHMDGRVLPLESLGTGIHEVIMIAAFCTISEEEIVCIEEPEIHLHPLLQRKLIKFLQDNTSNQYFIATHSSAFIDTPKASIYHVFQEENTTRIQRASLKRERYRICSDLGHRPSDIVQSNAVIWVEGPSDRIYLRHWLRVVDDKLSEGVHYSIMFYGGRLLSHLSANDEEVSEFIQLRDLNRNVAILIDSDKRTSYTTINATKKRIRDEFNSGGGMAWVTSGREIENYVEHERLQRAVARVYGERYGLPTTGGRYDQALNFFKRDPSENTKGASNNLALETGVDKVKVSRAVVSDGCKDLNVLDLNLRIHQLVHLIREANT